MKRDFANSSGVTAGAQSAQNVDTRERQFIRWSGLAATVYPILFVVVFTVAGFLRPGYSQVSQAISDLGVGPLGWLMDAGVIINGLVIIALAAGFFLATRPVMRTGWRWACAVLIAIPGFGEIVGGIFTEAPSTVLIHWLVGAMLGLYFPAVTFLVVGLRLWRTPGWRGFGIYSVVICVATVAAVVFTQLAFTPDSALTGLHIAGLAERLTWVVIQAWYVVLGWRLFRAPAESTWTRRGERRLA
jgi:hypothetical membrane protein